MLVVVEFGFEPGYFLVLLVEAAGADAVGRPFLQGELLLGLHRLHL